MMVIPSPDRFYNIIENLGCSTPAIMIRIPGTHLSQQAKEMEKVTQPA
jgi:hypothetical protein